jgi:hypothetical protein
MSVARFSQRVEMLAGALPGGVVDISIVLPSCDLNDEGLFAGDAAIEALG